MERLTAKYTIDSNGCWIWRGSTAGKHPWQYGVIVYNRKLRMAHRVAYEELIGRIPEKLELDHLCHTPLCVNPYHCELVSHQENIRRGYDLKPHKTQCVHGHALTEDNVYKKIRKGRESWECMICRAEQCKRGYYRRKASLQ